MNDDIVDKFKNILNEKGIDISNLTNAVNSNASDTSSSSYSNSDFTGESKSMGQADSPNSTSSPAFDIDINTILKLKSLMGTAQSKNSARIRLLEALKPFLAKEKQIKIDEYMKIANILSILEVLQENRR